MGMIGANPGDLRDLARSFDNAARKLDADRQAVRSALHRTPWRGPSAERFRSDWERRHHGNVGQLADTLRHNARDLRHQADDQEAASRKGAAGANQNRFLVFQLTLGGARRLVTAPFRFVGRVTRGGVDLARRSLKKALQLGGAAASLAWRTAAKVGHFTVGLGRTAAQYAQNAARFLWDKVTWTAAYFAKPIALLGAIGIAGLSAILTGQNPFVVGGEMYAALLDRLRAKNPHYKHAKQEPPRPTGSVAHDISAIKNLNNAGSPQVEIIQVSANPKLYRVVIAGIDGPNVGNSVNDLLSAGANQIMPSVYSEQVMKAIAAQIPSDAQFMIVGHSNGGVTAMQVANDPRFRGMVTNVIAVGAPISRHGVPPGVHVLEVNNVGDPVPSTDLRFSTSSPPNHIVRYVESGNRNLADFNNHNVDPHYSNGVDGLLRSDDPALRQFNDEIQRYYTPASLNEVTEVTVLAA